MRQTGLGRGGDLLRTGDRGRGDAFLETELRTSREREHRAAPTQVSAYTSAGMAMPSMTAAVISQGLTVCAANAKAFIAAEPASVPIMAGRANRCT
jgi:hypothetical protein